MTVFVSDVNVGSSTQEQPANILCGTISIDCSEHSRPFSRIFIWALNARIESRETWMPAQNGSLDWVEGGDRDKLRGCRHLCAWTQRGCEQITVRTAPYQGRHRGLRVGVSNEQWKHLLMVSSALLYNNDSKSPTISLECPDSNEAFCS